MKCQQIDEYIYAYCDNTISPETRLKVDMHLKDCAICRNKVKLTIMENEILKEHDELPVLSDDFTCRLINTIQLTSMTDKQYNAKKGLLVKTKNRLPYPVIASTAVVIILLLLFIPGIPGFRTGFKITDNNDSINESINNNLKHKTGENSPYTVKPNDTPIIADNSSADSSNRYPASSDQMIEYGTENQLRSELDDNDSNSEYKVYRNNNNREDSGKGSNDQFLYLQPSNIPANFKLATIISEIDDSLTFVYNDIKTGNDLNITITAASVKTADIPLGMGGEQQIPTPPPDKTELAEKNTTILESDTEQIIVQKNINYSDNFYTVTISSKLPSDEIAGIASSIDFKEAYNND